MKNGLLKYPDTGFLLLMILAMAVIGRLAAFILPYIVTEPHGTTFSLVGTAILGTIFIAGSYYLAKLMAWVIFRLRPPQP
jgi:hypothetical protein